MVLPNTHRHSRAKILSNPTKYKQKLFRLSKFVGRCPKGNLSKQIHLGYLFSIQVNIAFGSYFSDFLPFRPVIFIDGGLWLVERSFYLKCDENRRSTWFRRKSLIFKVIEKIEKNSFSFFFSVRTEWFILNGEPRNQVQLTLKWPSQTQLPPDCPFKCKSKLEQRPPVPLKVPTQ